MKPFTTHKGIAVPLVRINVDTDAIIPSREMMTVGKKGLSAGLFAGWRYLGGPGSRKPNPDFVLNQPAYAGASIILAGSNFGCGSSREHAVWALAEYGIRAIFAPSFGTIFQNNCTRNGILAATLDDAEIRSLAARIEVDPEHEQLEINLKKRVLIDLNETRYRFGIEPGPWRMLTRGLDEIGVTLELDGQIEAHLKQDRQQRPWAYLS